MRVAPRKKTFELPGPTSLPPPPRPQTQARPEIQASLAEDGVDASASSTAPLTYEAAARLPPGSPHQPPERADAPPSVEPQDPRSHQLGFKPSGSAEYRRRRSSAGLVEAGEEEEVFLSLTAATATRLTSMESHDTRPVQLGFRPSSSAEYRRRRSSVGLSAAAPQLSPPVLEDDWGAEKTFDEDGMEDTCSDKGEDDGAATMAPPAVAHPRANARARMSGNGVLGNDGKFAPPRVSI